MKNYRLLSVLMLILITGISSQLNAQISEKQIAEAQKIYDEGDYKEVLKLLKPAETLSEINGEAEMLLGDAHHKREEFIDAIEHYDRAEKAGIESFELYFHRARAYISVDEYRKASKDMDKVIDMQPDNAELYFFRAFAESEMNHLTNALKDYTKAIELDPEYKEAYYNRAATKMELEQFESLMADIEKADELGLESEYLDFTRAQYSYEQKQYEEALPLFVAIIEKTDDNATKGMANYYIAECYYNLGDIDESCKYFYKAAKFGDVDAQETFDNFCEKDQLRTLFKPRKKLEKVSF